MARIDGKFIKGKIGPRFYKKYRNKQLLQQTPEEAKDPAIKIIKDVY